MKRNIIFLVLFSLTACKTPAPTYRFSDTSTPHAEVSFSSNFTLHTHFSVDIEDAEKNVCRDYKTVGYLLYDDSIFLYDKSNKSIKINVPANKEISVQGLHRFNDPAYHANCGPIIASFTPEPGAKYQVLFANVGVIPKLTFGSSVPLSCRLVVSRIDTHGEETVIPVKALPPCNKSR
ncbi:hypothetical protein [Methylobacillus methanolivorans]